MVSIWWDSYRRFAVANIYICWVLGSIVSVTETSKRSVRYVKRKSDLDGVNDALENAPALTSLFIPRIRTISKLVIEFYHPVDEFVN